MDRNRFKTKASEVEDYAPKPRPRPVAHDGVNEVSPAARPVHHTTPRPSHHPAAPRQISHSDIARPTRPPQQANAPQPLPAQHARPVAHKLPSVETKLVPAPAPAAVAVEPEPVEEDIPELQTIDTSIPTTLPAKQKRLSKRRIAEIALVVTLLGTGFFVFKPEAKQDLDKSGASISGLHVNSAGAAANSTATVAGTVPFTPVTPTGKSQLANLGSSAYNAEYKSYSYDDTYMGQKIRVSQQELPSGQDSAAGLIEKIGASLKAQSVTPINIQSGQPAYILNNTSNAGSQVVVFTAKGKLLFVQAATAFDSSIWPDYLNSFQ